MSDTPGMQVEVGADVSGLISGLDQGGVSVKKFSETTGKAFDGIVTRSYNAKNVILNFGDAIRDIPFSVAAGNANALVARFDHMNENFQQLVNETGSVKGAISSLAQSFGGSGLLAIAIPAAGALFSLFSQKLFSTNDAMKKTADATQELAKAHDNIIKSVGEEEAKVSVLVTALESETATRKQKIDALKELKGVNSEYFGDLKLENGYVDGLTAAYQRYKDSILNVIANKVDLSKLEDIQAKLIANEEKANSLKSLQTVTQKQINDLYAKGDALDAQMLERQLKFQRGDTERNSLLNQQDEILKRIASRGYDGLIKDGGDDKVKKSVKSVSDIIAEMRKELELLDKEGIALNIDEAENKIGVIKNAISELIRTKGLNPNDKLILELIAEAHLLKVEDTVRKLREEFSQEVRPVDLKVPVKLDLKLDKSVVAKEAKEAAANGLEIFRKQYSGLLADLSKDLNNTMDQVFESLGKSIGKAILTGNIKDVFGSVFQVIGQGLEQMGGALIAYGLGIEALKNAIKDPTLAVLAGVGLEILGSALQNYIPHFAKGVKNFGGGVALVGERGPELVNLPAGSDVIPNHLIGGIGASQMPIQIYGQTIIRGNDMVTIWNRGQKFIGRNG